MLVLSARIAALVKFVEYVMLVYSARIAALVKFVEYAMLVYSARLQHWLRSLSMRCWCILLDCSTG